MTSLASHCSALASHWLSREAAASLPPGPEIDQTQSARAKEVCWLANHAIRSAWWPRGLGLHVDWGGRRHEFEPAEGARSWLQIARQPEGWGNDAQDFTVAGDEVESFTDALLLELRLHVGSLEPAVLRRLPATPREVYREILGDDWRSFRWARHDILARPPLRRISAGESLCPRFPLDLGPVKPQVSRQLGAMLQERFDWSGPVALEERPFKALNGVLAKGGAQERAWSLRVANDGGDVDLVMHDACGARSLGTVLKAGPHLQGAVIFRPQPFDDLGDAAVRLAAFHRAARHPDERFFVPKADRCEGSKPPLAALHRGGRVVVVAHGGMLSKGASRHHVLEVGGRTPDALARDLIANGLPRRFAGTVFLSSCGSMTDALHPRAYAEQLRAALASRGFDEVSVAMQPGISSGEGPRARTFPEADVRASPGSNGGRFRLPTAREPKRRWYLRPWDGLRRLFGKHAVPGPVHADKVSTEVISGGECSGSTDPRGVQRMWAFFGAIKQRR